jgi:hypothetical protein
MAPLAANPTNHNLRIHTYILDENPIYNIQTAPAGRDEGFALCI